MEKVWEELKRIETKAEQIRIDAKQTAKELGVLAQQESEKLLEDSKKYADQQGQQIYTDTVEEAKRNRNQQLKANLEATEKIRAQAEQRMDDASSAIVAAVLGET